MYREGRALPGEGTYMKRKSGILMAMSSLPSPYGIGTMGKSAYEFVDFLKAADQSWWQLLPLGPTGYGDSPYASFSSFAGNPYFIDLDMLAQEGLITREEIGENWGEDPQRVDYGAVYAGRYPVLRLAFERGKTRLSQETEAFRRENASWVENYALFMALKNHFSMKCWVDWPEEDIRLHRPDAVERYRALLREDVDFWVFCQFLFYRQWNALRAYAKEQGIRFIGDVPIYVALDSADVWAERDYFRLGADGLPLEVAGVPPDAFTADGQLWGNPLYDWDRMKADGYGWWIRRIEGAKKLYDMIRIDHFRGLESYWAVPAGEATARNGKWKPGPGMGLVGVLVNWFADLEFIAEDLGYITPEVRKLLTDSGLPGMKILEFGFDPHGDSDYMPHNCSFNSVCYVGTHDNETARGWVKAANAATLRYAREYLQKEAGESWCHALLRAGMGTGSRLFIMQMQDVLELGRESRMNAPGTLGRNWQWRMKPGAATPRRAEAIRTLTHCYRRDRDDYAAPKRTGKNKKA